MHICPAPQKNLQRRLRRSGPASAPRKTIDPMATTRHKSPMNAVPTPHAIFDLPLVRQRLARAWASGFEGFLLHRALEDLLERLAVIQRPFPVAVDLATPAPDLALALAQQHELLQLAQISAVLATAGGRVADPETLPLQPASVDLVASLLALHVINDLPGTLVQIRRALRPDGLFIACMSGGQTLHELRTCLTSAESEICGGASPRVIPFADVRDMGALLQRAGFALPVADIDSITVRYDSAFALMAELRAMGATNPLVARSRKPLPRAVFLRAAELYRELYADADGRIRATFEMIWVSGWAPHDNQQKPLRPGSAKMRLAEALGTREGKL